MNSFVVDYWLKRSISKHVSFFYVYATPVPRLNIEEREFGPIFTRSARLICTTPEFDDLAKSVGLRDHRDGATDAAERGRLRAELDAMVAHLYGLTEEEFAYIRTTFPLVEQAAKDATLAAYRSAD